MRSGRTTRSNWRGWPQEMPGTYTCQAENMMGKTEASAALTVHGKNTQTHAVTHLTLLWSCSHLSIIWSNECPQWAGDCVCALTSLFTAVSFQTNVCCFDSLSGSFVRLDAASFWIMPTIFFLAVGKSFFFFLCILRVKQDYFCHFSEASFPPQCHFHHISNDLLCLITPCGGNDILMWKMADIFMFLRFLETWLEMIQLTFNLIFIYFCH